MTTRSAGLFLTLFAVSSMPAMAQQRPNATASADTAKAASLSYAKDLAPVIAKACLPCHAADNENPSGLSLDSFEVMMKGGEHGKPVVAGKPDESILLTKLFEKPPFGKQMPKKRPPLTKQEVDLITAWIVQGAKP
jgi:uncharacterized membrane protein